MCSYQAQLKMQYQVRSTIVQTEHTEKVRQDADEKSNEEINS